MNTALLLDRAATAPPQHTAVYAGTQPLCTYRELRNQVAALALAMTEPGCARGERVAIVMGNRPEHLHVLLAAWWAGLSVVPVNAKLHPRELAWIVHDAKAGPSSPTRNMVAQQSSGPAAVSRRRKPAGPPGTWAGRPCSPRPPGSTDSKDFP